jgi:hypothetical protein
VEPEIRFEPIIAAVGEKVIFVLSLNQAPPNAN